MLKKEDYVNILLPKMNEFLGDGISEEKKIKIIEFIYNIQNEAQLHTKEWYENYAKKNGYKLGKIFDKMYDAVNKCEGYCPCKYTIYQKNKPSELEDIRCPCVFIKEDMEKTGHCHCKMFEKGEK